MCREPIEFMHINGLKIALTSSVYVPSHDTAILINIVHDVLSKHKKLFQSILVEIGSGTGYVALTIFSKFKHSLYMILIDISPCATLCTWINLKRYFVDCCADVVQCDSASCLRSAISRFISFNPPYIPEEDIRDLSDLAVCGGPDGTEVWRLFYADAVRICKRPCYILFVLSSLQNLEIVFKTVLNTCSSLDVYDCYYFFFESICGAVVRCEDNAKGSCSRD